MHGMRGRDVPQLHRSFVSVELRRMRDFLFLDSGLSKLRHELPCWFIRCIDLQLRVVRLWYFLRSYWCYRLGSVHFLHCWEVLECGGEYLFDLWLGDFPERLWHVNLFELRCWILCCLSGGTWMRILRTWNRVAGDWIKLVQQLRGGEVRGHDGRERLLVMRGGHGLGFDRRASIFGVPLVRCWEIHAKRWLVRLLRLQCWGVFNFKCSVVQQLLLRQISGVPRELGLPRVRLGDFHRDHGLKRLHFVLGGHLLRRHCTLCFVRRGILREQRWCGSLLQLQRGDVSRSHRGDLGVELLAMPRGHVCGVVRGERLRAVCGGNLL